MFWIPMDLQNMQMRLMLIMVRSKIFVDSLEIYGVESTGVVAGTPAQLFHWQDEVYTEGISTKVGASASGVLTEAITIFLLDLTIKKVLSQLLLKVET